MATRAAALPGASRLPGFARWRGWAGKILYVVLLIVGWKALVTGLRINPLLFPPPDKVFEEWLEFANLILYSCGITLVSAVIGFVIATHDAPRPGPQRPASDARCPVRRAPEHSPTAPARAAAASRAVVAAPASLLLEAMQPRRNAATSNANAVEPNSRSRAIGLRPVSMPRARRASVSACHSAPSSGNSRTAANAPMANRSGAFAFCTSASARSVVRPSI